MLSKVIDWTAGSFFRTIGRLLVFVILGFIIANLVDFSDIISNFRITDLFFEKVNADTFLNTFATNWTNSQGQQIGTIGEYAYQSATTTTTEGQFSANEFYINLIADQSKGSYIEIPFYMTIPRVSSTTTSTIYGQDYCERYDCALLDTSTNTCSRYTCIRVNTGQDSTITDKELLEFKSMVYAIIVYNTGYADVCDFDKTKNSLVCPITSNQPVQSISRVIVWSKIYASNVTSGYTYQVGLGIRSRAYKSDTQSIIDNQNQNTQQQMQQSEQQHNEIMDTNTTETESDATSFFEDFSVSDHGGLSSILTAPLTIFNSILNDTCVPATFTYRGKQVSLPCGQDFWNQAPNLRDWLSTLESGIIAYAILISLFKMIQKLESPSNSEVEVESL